MIKMVVNKEIATEKTHGQLVHTCNIHRRKHLHRIHQQHLQQRGRKDTGKRYVRIHHTNKDQSKVSLEWDMT